MELGDPQTPPTYVAAGTRVSFLTCGDGLPGNYGRALQFGIECHGNHPRFI